MQKLEWIYTKDTGLCELLVEMPRGQLRVWIWKSVEQSLQAFRTGSHLVCRQFDTISVKEIPRKTCEVRREAA